jgi:hypothetical protein
VLYLYYKTKQKIKFENSIIFHIIDTNKQS